MSQQPSVVQTRRRYAFCEGDNETRIFSLAVVSVVSATLFATACSKADTNDKDRVKSALEQADLKDVRVSELTSKNTIRLGGTVHTDDAKNRAANIAQASAGPRVVPNEISVEPVGHEGDARKVESNLDDGIENNFKAVWISKGLDKPHIRYHAKNGVLTLKGSVKEHNAAAGSARTREEHAACSAGRK
jgi:BON domain